jgi:hypothetical protein
MKSEEEEIRRLQRIRDQQLRDRDPHAKKNAQYQRVLTQYQGREKKISLRSVVNDLPAKFWYMIIGALLGAVLALALLILIPEPWVKTVGWIAILFGLVSGRVLGAARDWGKEDWTKKRR